MAESEPQTAPLNLLEADVRETLRIGDGIQI